MSRRGLLLGAAALGCVAAVPGATGAVRVVPLRFDSGTAYVIVPEGGPTGQRFPLVIALHGRGEARKGPERGGLGWPQDYALPHLIARVSAPPLTAEDLGGLADPERLRAQNADLAARPFGGLVVACPYVPDLEMYDDDALDAYGAFVTGPLLAKLNAELPVFGTAASTGIDGVSLGGRIALHVGLAAPERFGAVGGIQPAVRVEEAVRWTTRAAAARARNPGLALRLLTSDGDFFRPAIAATSEAWTKAGVAHTFAEVPGPHDYAFNRGPGGVELLLFQDRALARA